MSVPVSLKHRSRAWILTLWSKEDVSRLEMLEAPCLVVGEEVAPTTGKTHFHAYIRFTHPHTFSSLHLQFPNAHIEPMRGTDAEAIQYCKKDQKVIIDRIDPGLVRGISNPKVKGEVEVEVHRRLRDGETIRAVWADHPIYAARNMRMLRSIVRVYELWGHREDGNTVDNLSGLDL